MPPSEAQKIAAAKWDKENTVVLACKATKEKAERFKEYCAARDKSVHAVLLDYVEKCIDEP